MLKKSLKMKWLVPVAALVLTVSIGSAAFAAAGASSTDTTAAATSTAVTTTATSSASTSTDVTTGTDATSGTDAGTSSPAAAGATKSDPWGHQRSDETLLTGDALAKVTAVAQQQAGSDAKIVRVETDSDASQSGHAAYEAHAVKADGTAETIYVDKSFNYVSTEAQPADGHGCRGGNNDGDSDDAGSTTSTSASTTTN